jgi:hypothetical protein
MRVTTTAVVAGGLAIGAVAGYGLGARRPAIPATHLTEAVDHEEVRRLHDEDQADRSAASDQDADWSVIEPRDTARRERVKALFASGALQTANDYYHAAMVLQHGDAPDDFLLAHEFCVVAITKGRNDRGTRWLAASAEDRFLMSIGRPQRFATQFRSVGDAPARLHEVDESVTDQLRGLMDAPSLEAARAHEAELNKDVSVTEYSKADADVLAPVEVERRLPAWPPAPASEGERRGVIELVIGETGAVTFATITDPTIAAYDAALLRATGQWRFGPAMRDGKPVKYRMSVDVVVPR